MHISIIVKGLGIIWVVLCFIIGAQSASAEEADTRVQWDGFYAGVRGGGGWGLQEWSRLHFPNFKGSGQIDGTILGGQAGYNVQSGPWVVGAEASVAKSNLTGHTPCESMTATCSMTIDWIGAFSGRIGFASGYQLFYLRGGVTLTADHDTAIVPTVVNGINLHDHESRFGTSVGAGVEYAMTTRWSIFGEYDYLPDTTNNKYYVAPNGNHFNLDLDRQSHLFTVGMNYHFNDLGDDDHIFALLREDAAWVWEIGPRYWYSTGTTAKQLFASGNATQMNSRLTYSGLDAQSGEVFGRLDHASGLVFVKGYLGMGEIGGGKLNDEDFPPAISPYSNTVSRQEGGRLRYGSVDLGHTFAAWDWGRVSGLIGYHYLKEVENAYGCLQVGSNNGVCAPTPWGTNYLTLSETRRWQSLRLGVAGDIHVLDQVKVTTEAVYLPMTSMSALDNHWLRPSINPLPETGMGTGSQFELSVVWDVTSRWSVGAGGRYWYFATPKGETVFPGYVPSPLNSSTERYGGFLQTSYKFGA